MLQRGFLIAAVLSVAAWCATPGLAPAGKGGGHGGGGGHAGGGAHMGGAHMGGTHMGGTHMGGGSRSGVFFGSPFYGFYGGGLYPYGYGYGGAYGLSYGSYGYGAPLLGGYYPQRYSYYPQYPLGGDVMPQAPALYASIRVILPDGAAKVQFDGSDTKQTGTERLFYTPDLDPNGGPYSYRIRAAWKVGDQDMVQERVVGVAPGQTSTADFR